jgi:hypothetical protein
LDKNLIKTGADFNELYAIRQPHRTFFMLQPLITEIESLVMRPFVGAFTYAARIVNAQADRPVEMEAQELAKRALANLTIAKATTKLHAQIGPDGFTVKIAGPSDGHNNDKQAAPDRQLVMLAETAERDGQNFLRMLRNHLNAHASDTIFPEYYASELYTNPNVKREDINTQMGGLFTL